MERNTTRPGGNRGIVHQMQNLRDKISLVNLRALNLRSILYGTIRECLASFLPYYCSFAISKFYTVLEYRITFFVKLNVALKRPWKTGQKSNLHRLGDTKPNSWWNLLSQHFFSNFYKQYLCNVKSDYGKLYNFFTRFQDLRDGSIQFYKKMHLKFDIP